MNNKLKLLVTIATFILVIFTSIGYAALNTDLSISGDAYVRVEDDIRVTSIKMISSENNAYETYNNKYTKDTTSTYVTMPNTNSKLTYEIEITNDSNSRYYLSDILENSYSNKNIKYEIQDISVGDIIPSNTVKKIKIVFTTNTPNQNTAVVLQYVFKKVEQTEWVYAYTGGEQTFTVPYNGRYKLETWGAQGGSYNEKYYGGYGAYSAGNIILKKDTKLYVYVGQTNDCIEGSSGSYTTGGYNGGGSAGTTKIWPSRYFCGGGGATDIRLVNGYWSDFNSLKSRIIVSAGGGGADYFGSMYQAIGGSGGGLIGSKSSGNIGTSKDIINYIADGGKQISGSSFGKGHYEVTSGGGSGYFGGFSAEWGGGAGGSSFISGHIGSVAILENSNDSSILFRKDSYGVACNDVNSLGYNSLGYNKDYECSKHYSGYVFTNTIMIDGNGYKWKDENQEYVGQVQPDGTTSVGHLGNGYAKITFIGN